ncbi:MAG: 4Fe-4S dicluster domain-containing protein [Peptococcaceae bacterium]|nr:4Fe-4S dicluster domain-containing protein [Candidatus Syntrophopropionicum ammoniitolerans]
MKAKIVNKGQLSGLLDKLAKDYDLVAPVKEETITLFKKISSAQDAFLDYTNSDVSPKGCFLPQSEKIFSYTYTGDSLEIVKPESAKKTVLFGARPCDIKAITTLDPVFEGEKFGDEFYSSKRENTVIIGLSCSKVLSTCFCYAFGGGPCDGTGSDLLFTEIGDKYYVEINTDKGQALVDANSQFFSSESTDQLAKDKEELAKKLAGEFVKKVDLTGVKELLDSDFELAYWDEDPYKKCIGCGTCTYVCPTCHCFDIFDFTTGDITGDRIRCWDSCMYPEYTLMAGGHNPRPTRKERIRNRFMHKLKYHLDRYNMVGCVGCGRCIRKCPVNIDITKIINDLKEVAQNA